MQVRRLSALVVADGRQARRARQRFLDRHASLRLCSSRSRRRARARRSSRATAAIDVSVATLWKAPNLYRVDRPAVGDEPGRPGAWSRNLATTASRVWLDSHVQTQALYGAAGDGARACSGGWAKVAVRDEPDPQDPHGYPGWLPVSQLTRGLRRRRAAGRRRCARTRRMLPRARADAAAQLRHAAAARPVARRRRGRAHAGRRTARSRGARAAAPRRRTRRSSRRRSASSASTTSGAGSPRGASTAPASIWDVYRAHGMTIPRDADPQFRHGTPVARDCAAARRPALLRHAALRRPRRDLPRAAAGCSRRRTPRIACGSSPVRWTDYVGARRYTSS